MTEKFIWLSSYLLTVAICPIPYLLLDSVLWAALLTVPTFLVALLVTEHFYKFVLSKRAP
ncbi:hypothetical protein [Acidovorax sp. sic0104]|uniref:hypothetical protein n=1 Tax=Acidovorax sp. sic0104 TaxID=2854784 RepID=UPI001C46CBE3|nr:hypothetical protein [Acidovorax sp. sic0104]MBV7542538.1 hypothetical protein [Acidovorax sp. sic0104]